MDDLFDFDNEMRDQAEIKRLSGIIEEMRRAGIKLRNELSDFIETAKSDNEDSTVFPAAQDAISEWNELIKDSDLAWKEEILSVPSEAKLILE